MMARAIFISYRRDDTEGEAGRLFDDLTRSFGESSVFMDVAGITPGADFRKAIDDNVASCGVLLAVIGPQWATMADNSGVRRLDNPDDFVRLEVASALARDVAVIPVLVHDAKMPRPDQLPDNLRDLAFRNSVELTHARWNSDVQLLTNALGRYVSPSAESDTRPVHATVSVQLPPPTPPARTPATGRRSSMPLVLGIVVAVVVALGVVGFMLFRPDPTPGPNPSPTAAPASAPAPVSDFSALTGSWINAEDAGSVTRLEITADGDQLSIHAWSKCSQGVCDWGIQHATVDGAQQAMATFSSSDQGQQRTAIVTAQPLDGDLSVLIQNTFSDRGPNSRTVKFSKEKP